jgi:hypothetical protein
VGLLRRDQGRRGHLAELGIISAKGRNGTAELFKIIADEAEPLARRRTRLTTPFSRAKRTSRLRARTS